MVFGLTPDVIGYRVELRDAYTKGAVFFLPGKEPLFGKGFVNPFRGTALNKLERFGNGNGGGQSQEKVNMVFYTADLERFEFILPGDPANEREKTFAKRRG
jgi:hypothetical protein